MKKRTPLPTKSPLQTWEKKLIAKLLRMASKEYGNHGCNDFDLVTDGGLTRKEASRLKLRLEAHDTEDEKRESGDFMTSDFHVMNVMAHRIEDS